MVTRDRAAASGRRIAFKAVGVVAGIALAVVVAVLVLEAVHAHKDRDTGQANEAKATAQASAAAQSFYQRLLVAAAPGPLTGSELDALSRGTGIAVAAPAADGDAVVVQFRVSKVYIRPGDFEAGQGLVQLCYRANLPKSHPSGSGSLSQISCLAGTY